MKGKVIFLWCLLGAVIITYLIVQILVKDYNIDQVKPVDEMSQVETTVVKGYDIPKDYKANLTSIKEKKTDFTIVGKDNSLIPFEGLEGLDKILYKMSDYFKIEYTNEGIKYMIYSINDYDLLERTVTAKASYNKELLAMYLGKKPDELASGQEKVRDLLEGEVYGKTVISTFEARKDKFEDGYLYFIVDDEEIFKLDDLKLKVAEYDIFKKEYETDSESNVLGYTFTKVLE